MTHTIHTQAEENYLKAIYKIAEQGGEPVPTNGIAAEVNTAAASVTDMLKRLADKHLISYEKYRGVRLTPEGRKIATALVRKHRLWETFLASKLGFPWEKVHELAEQLEHIQGEELVARLDQFLGYPRFDPHGGPIPDAQGHWESVEQVSLGELAAGQRGKVSNVADDSAVFLKYLNQLGIGLGSDIEMLEHFAFDHSVKIRLDGRETVLSEKVCRQIFIHKV